MSRSPTSSVGCGMPTAKLKLVLRKGAAMTGTANLLNGLAHEAGDATSECARLLAEWRQAVADHVAAVHADVEGASCTAADKRKDDIAHRAWATPVSDP